MDGYTSFALATFCAVGIFTMLTFQYVVDRIAANISSISIALTTIANHLNDIHKVLEEVKENNAARPTFTISPRNK